MSVRVRRDGSVVVSEETWAQWDVDCRAAAAVSRQRLAGDAPIDVVLYALRQWKAGAYAACTAPNRWAADCPACGCDRSVAVLETSERGAVTMWCRTGCSQPSIVAELAAWRDAKARDQVLDEARERITDLEQVVDRLCEHIATEAVA
jgi:hypothetical protein